MRRLWSTLALALVLGGLLGYIFMSDVRESTGSDTEAKEKAFASTESADIDEIGVKAADGQTTRLKNEGGTWKIVEPEEGAADQSEISSMTGSLASLDIQRVVDDNATDLKQYGLDPARIEVEFKVKGGKDPRRLHLGDKTPTGGDLYARLPDQKRVFLVGSFLDSTFNKNTFALRDKSIIKLERDKVDRIEIVADKRSVTLAKNGNEWQMLSPVKARADFAAVEGALERLSSAQMQGIIAADGGDLQKYKLEPPVASFAAIAGSARATLLFGETENALIYAKDASRPAIFTVAPTLYTDLVRDAGEFRRKDLFDARSFTANHVEFVRNGETITLDKTKNKDGSESWKNGTGKDIHAMKVEDLLSKVTALRADSFESGADPALKKPSLVVTIRFDDNKMEQVTFARSANDILGSRSDEAGVAKLAAAGFDEVYKGIDEMK